MADIKIEGWIKTDWDDWRKESDRIYASINGVCTYYKRLPSPLTKEQEIQKEKNKDAIEFLKNLKKDVCIDPECEICNPEINNCQKDFAGENMEEKKEVKWWFNKPNMSNREDNFRGLLPNMIKQLFDAYHAQKAELEKCCDRVAFFEDASNEWKEIALDLKRKYTQLQSKQPDESEGEWEIREAIPWIVDATHEYRKVIQRRLKPSPKADSDDGNLANEKRTAYHQQRRIPSPQAEQKSNKEHSLDIEAYVWGKDSSNISTTGGVALMILGIVDKKIKETK